MPLCVSCAVFQHRKRLIMVHCVIALVIIANWIIILHFPPGVWGKYLFGWSAHSEQRSLKAPSFWSCPNVLQWHTNVFYTLYLFDFIQSLTEGEWRKVQHLTTALFFSLEVREMRSGLTCRLFDSIREDFNVESWCCLQGQLFQFLVLSGVYVFFHHVLF